MTTAAPSIALEPLRVDHADEMTAVLADEVLYEFMGGRGPSRAELAERYHHQVAGSGDPNEQWFNWIARRSDTAEAAGFVQATVTGLSADLAWLIGVAHQGHGFAVQGARLMVAELAASGIRLFTAHIHPGHHRSQLVASALGMSRTGQVDDDGEEVWQVVPENGPAMGERTE